AGSRTSYTDQRASMQEGKGLRRDRCLRNRGWAAPLLRRTETEVERNRVLHHGWRLSQGGVVGNRREPDAGGAVARRRGHVPQASAADLDGDSWRNSGG